MKKIKQCFTAIPFLLLLLAISFKGKAESPFTTRWNLTVPTFTYPGIGEHYTIEWEQVNNPQVKGVIEDAGTRQVIQIPSNGEYYIRAYNGNGVLSGFSLASDNYTRLLAIEQWGSIQWTRLDHAFNSAINMDVTATDVPDLSQVSSLSGIFFNCSKLVGNASFERWNTASVRDMSWMFSGASLFNQDISGWNTGNVTTMRAMFQYAKAFNQPIGSWNTQWVKSMENMFYQAEQFNQSIGNWNTESVTTMSGMFVDAKAFNQPIGSWNVENVITIDNMFLNAVKFNQPLNNWNTRKLRTMTSAFRKGASFNQSLGHWTLQSITDDKRILGAFEGTAIDCENYAATLAGWADNPLTPDGIQLDAAGLSYDAAAIPIRERLISEKNWAINNDQYTAICGVLPVTFGKVAATHKNNWVLVTWETMSETACDRFIIQASADGRSFTDIGEVKSKSENGDSNILLSYDYELPLLPITSAVPVALLAVGVFAGKRRWLLYFIAAFTMLIWVGCKRDSSALNVSHPPYKFIRIAQVDKDNTDYHYSKVITIAEQ